MHVFAKIEWQGNGNKIAKKLLSNKLEEKNTALKTIEIIQDELNTSCFQNSSYSIHLATFY